MVWKKVPGGGYIWTRLGVPQKTAGSAIVVMQLKIIYIRAFTKNGEYENALSVYTSTKWDGFQCLTGMLLANGDKETKK